MVFQGSGRYSIFLAAFVLAACGGGGGGGGGDGDDTDGDTTPPPSPFEISGTIDIEANTRVDEDTAELIETFNGTTVTEPQGELPSSVILGGYISGTSGEHPTDDQTTDVFEFPQDAVDAFNIPLEPGQTVTVQFFPSPIRSGDSAELPNTELVLLEGGNFDPADAEVVRDTQPDPAPQRQVTLPDSEPAAIYRIRLAVLDSGGPVRYILSTTPTGDVANAQWMSHDFAPGEALVTLREGPFISAQAVTGEAAMAVARDLGGSRVLARMPEAVEVRLQALGKTSPRDRKQATLEWIQRLRERPDVASANPNYRTRALAPEAQPLFSQQWHYPLINLPTAWQLEPSGGDGVRVAVLDTGVFAKNLGADWHVDLIDNIAGCSSGSPTGCFDAVDGGLPRDPGPSFGSSVFHGTHVAGTVAALAQDPGEGGTGVAFGATLVPVRVLDGDGSGTAADLIEGINWVANTGGDPRADVMNMSLGGLPDIPEVQAAIDEAVQQGVIPVGASGNAGASQVDFPAAHQGVFAVGAVDGAGNRSSFSNGGAALDLMAPGGDLSRDANGDGVADAVISASGTRNPAEDIYLGLQGTSMAAPHVAGVFALMKKLDKSLDAATLEAMLTSGELTEDIDPAGRDNATGHGLIDAVRSIEAVEGGLPTLLTPSPGVLSFEGGTTRLTLELVPTRDDPPIMGVNSVATDAPWLSLTQDPNSPLLYQAELVESELEEGMSFQSTVEVSYDDSEGLARTFSVPAAVTVESPASQRDAGLHFVLLLDAETGEPVAQTEVFVDQGEYDFSFTEATFPQGEEPIPGNYQLVAGTDLDNDGIICAAGEACAEFPNPGLRQVIEITADNPSRTGLGFTSSFSRPLSAQSLPRPGFEGYRLLQRPVQGVPQRNPEAP